MSQTSYLMSGHYLRIMDINYEIQGINNDGWDINYEAYI